MNDLFKAHSVGGQARLREQVDPKHGDRLMIFFRLAAGGRDHSQCFRHFCSRFRNRARFVEINPRDVQMRAVMEACVWNLPALERTRQFYIIHGWREFRPMCRGHVANGVGAALPNPNSLLQPLRCPELRAQSIDK